MRSALRLEIPYSNPKSPSKKVHEHVPFPLKCNPIQADDAWYLLL